MIWGAGGYATGNLGRLVTERHVVGVTTTPTIFARAITGSDACDEQLRDLALRKVGVEEALRSLTTADVREACDGLRPVFEAGMARAHRAGRELTRIAAVASVFVSRIDTEIDARLDTIGTAQAAALRGRAALANPRLAYQRYEQMAEDPRWQPLADTGARPQRPLCAETGVKDPAYPDTRYVTELVAPGVVNTMPQATLDAVADHGEIPDNSITGTFEDARRVLNDLAAVGIDYDEVMQTLEDQGVTAFDASWDQMAAPLREALIR